MNTSSLKTHKKGNFIKGIGYGIATVSCWGVMNVTTHDALRSGFLPNDLTMLRYCIAGMICLPWVLVNHSKEQGLLPWLKASVFALLAGPLYGWLVNKGMQLTPLTYASVMVPTFTMLITILLLFSMKIDVSKNQVIGTFVIIFGLYSLISSNSNPSPQSQMGVLAFLLAGFIWSCFTILLKKWELELVPTIFMMNIVSGIVYVPIFLSSEQSELSSIPIEHWAEQIVVQSILASIVVVFTFAKAVEYLGASIASTLPALIPLVSISLAIWFFEQSITTNEKIALTVISIGFVLCTLCKHTKKQER
ncbi:hypothetical protein CGH85_17215 [Vibrio parahaemolyticus]|uniref:DMT family transporter n=1 Tax=Vibrio parahaemolyticus TaxID=670 RepID=UPI00111FAC12|nr:DMT family transporter [Vibrio parahaemolyticus]EGQ9247510.1 DMT family transporter [Vibrio parahaemolyticus]EJG1182806.1 DMT family transporter [Vibrio parahaemolyticus]EJG1191978.1 DMT family transporter [Vibrio parahaemolyticus]EJU9839308.1 DMT family transporter [Vibrio parahaemolyticus]EKO5218872.1 DMT family transporter [Vibrio parahaemolyticus]